jgi:hypothetical protein
MTIPARTRAQLHERAQDCCERCGLHGANNAHHRKNQSQGGHDRLSNLLLLCGSGTTGCHGFVTTNPTMSIVQGWTVPREEDPAEYVLFRFDLTVGDRVLVRLDDDGTIHHPDDTEEIPA